MSSPLPESEISEDGESSGDESEEPRGGPSWLASVGRSLAALGGKLRDTVSGADDGLADYLEDVLEEDALGKFREGFKFRPQEFVHFPFACNLVSKTELIECMAFVTDNFMCFLGNKEGFDDHGRRTILRVVIPLRTIEKIMPNVCVVKGVYNEGEPVDALLLCTPTAKHQIVWIDEFERARMALLRCWEAARSPERAEDPLPVSLVLNPEFASSLSASSAEASPRAQQRVLRSVGSRERLSLREEELQEDVDAVSDEYDSDHIESVRSIERAAHSSTPSPALVMKPVAKDRPESTIFKAESGASGDTWASINI